MSSNTIQKIKGGYGDCRRCSEHGTGCNVHLSDLNYVALKGEELVQHSEKICDCFIFDDRSTLIIHLVELKSRRYEESDVREKFENSLKECSNMMKKVVGSDNLYTPILVLVALKHRDVERRKLQKPITFKKKRASFDF